MNIIVTGQEAEWTKRFSHLCEKKNIQVFEKSQTFRGEEPHLQIIDFPLEEARKGILTKIPFLVMSRETREEKILEAFAAGAEDYMVRPVLLEVAAARVERILQRYYESGQELRAVKEGMHFTPNEYRVLSCLMSCPGKVFSRNELIHRALGEEFDGVDRGIDNYIRQIRAKVEEDPSKPEHILTIYGIGYKYIP